jgi:hypothetical protein
VIDALRAPQSARITVSGRAVAPAAAVIAEIDAAMRQELGERSLRDLIEAA